MKLVIVAVIAGIAAYMLLNSYMPEVLTQGVTVHGHHVPFAGVLLAGTVVGWFTFWLKGK